MKRNTKKAKIKQNKGFPYKSRIRTTKTKKEDCEVCSAPITDVVAWNGGMKVCQSCFVRKNWKDKVRRRQEVREENLHQKSQI